LLSSAKTVNKQGYIHASYQVEKMACFKYYEYSFLYSFSGIFSGLKLQVIWRL